MFGVKRTPCWQMICKEFGATLTEIEVWPSSVSFSFRHQTKWRKQQKKMFFLVCMSLRYIRRWRAFLFLFFSRGLSWIIVVRGMRAFTETRWNSVSYLLVAVYTSSIFSCVSIAVFFFPWARPGRFVVDGQINQPWNAIEETNPREREKKKISRHRQKSLRGQHQRDTKEN